VIHLGYAYELSNREIAMEALAMAATCYNFLHNYLDETLYTRSSTYSTSSPLEILSKVALDSRFDKIFDHEGKDRMEVLFHDHEAILLEHWNAWQIPSPREQFQASQEAAVALLAATQEHGVSAYDFFLVHLLTSSHAIRILLPSLPAQFHVSLVRQWWLLTLAVYICQLRPKVNLPLIRNTDITNKDWKCVSAEAVKGAWSSDAHFVKGIRAMKEAANTWGDPDLFYLKAAVRFSSGFNGWSGFGAR
jgi:hypothetical protein